MKHASMRLLSGILLLGIAPYALPGGASGSYETLAPLDESENVPSLGLFLEKLRVAVKERDADFVQSALAQDVALGFGPRENGIEPEALLSSDSGSKFWQILESSIFYGGTFVDQREGGTFCMPYVYSAFPDHLDPIEYQVLITPSVSARSDPNNAAMPVSLPDFAVVRTNIGSAVTTNDVHGIEWARIYVGDSTAYVPASTIRSPLEGRTCLRKRDGYWRITAVIDGD